MRTINNKNEKWNVKNEINICFMFLFYIRFFFLNYKVLIMCKREDKDMRYSQYI